MKARLAGFGAVLVTGLTLGFSGVASAYANLDACPVLAQGYTGGCVTELQTELNIDEGANLTTDGNFGPLTKQAVITFQQAHGLAADGIVGPQTKQALMLANSVPTPRPGQPLPPAPAPSEEHIDPCMISTASHCPASHDNPDIEPGTIHDGYELWQSGAENSGETFDMPGELVTPFFG